MMLSNLYLSFEFNVFKGYINHVEPPCFTVLESEEIPYVGACESPGRGQRSWVVAWHVPLWSGGAVIGGPRCSEYLEQLGIIPVGTPSELSWFVTPMNFRQ